MVIVCQKCQTRFQLDESRIPRKGARVRCSRCKHAFVVAPPGAHDETIHGLAAEAARTGRPAVPEPTADLPPPARRAGRAASGEEGEDDWQFNIEPPSAPAAPAPSRPAPPAAAAAAAASVEPAPLPPPVEPPRVEARPAPASATPDDAIESLFELGGLADPDPAVLEGEITDSDPTPFEDDFERAPAPARKPAPSVEALAAERWDFSLDDAGPVATPVAARAGASSRRGGSDAPTASTEAPVAAARAGKRPRRERGVRLAGAEPGLAARVLAAAAWLPAAALFGLGLLGAVQPAPVVGELPSERLGPLEVTGLHARHLDNYWSGPLLVVQGEIQNPGPDAVSLGGAPQVRLAVTAGAVPAPGWLGAALHESALRERDPRELAAALEHSARQLAARPLRPGEALAVQAVFEAAAPLAATGLRLELAAVAPASEGLGGEAAPEDGPRASGDGLATPEGDAAADAARAPAEPEAPAASAAP